MTYEQFKIDLAAMVTNLAGEEVDVTVQKVQKNNGIVLDSISVMKVGCRVAPSIYLNELYPSYEEGVPLEELARKVLYLSEKGKLPAKLPEDFFMEYEKIRSRVCYRLINYEKNRQMLSEVPHKRLLDLAVVFYYSVEPELLKNASVLIRNVDIQRWNVTQEELEKDARENTPKVHKWQFITLSELLGQILEERKVAVRLGAEAEALMPMYILTNEEKYFGASCILYPQVLEWIAETLNNHFYILPSSIHECIIMPDSGYFSKETLSKMVAEINESQLEEIEVLSDSAYFYDRNTKKIKL